MKLVNEFRGRLPFVLLETAPSTVHVLGLIHEDMPGDWASGFFKVPGRWFINIELKNNLSRATNVGFNFNHLYWMFCYAKCFFPNA